MALWQVNQARNHWSELLDQAEIEGPQVITHHGKERAVVLSVDTYRSLTPEPPKDVADKPDFITFLLSAPKFDWLDDELERDKSVHDREIDLL